jgi:hypothetical protein
MALTLVLALLYSHRQISGNKLQEELTKPVTPALTNAISTNATTTSFPATTETNNAPATPAPPSPDDS